MKKIKKKRYFCDGKRTNSIEVDLMDIKTIIAVLNSESFPFPLEEIERIMDAELEKDPAEMDDELVDLCMDVLEKGYVKQKQNREQTEKKHRRIKLRRVLVAAAIIALIIVIAVPIAAAYTRGEVSDKIVQFYSDYFHINLREGDTNANHYSDENSDLIQELQKRGVSDVILPSDLLNYDYSKDIFIQEGDNYTSATITIEDSESKIHGGIVITQYDEIISSATGAGQVSPEFNRIEQININGLDVIIFGNEDKVAMRYLDNNTDYYITLDNCDIYKAVEIANSLK